MITITDRRSISAVDVGIELARAFQRLHPKDWQGAKFAKLLVHPATQEAVAQSRPLSEIHKSWVAEREAFVKRRQAALIY